MPCARFCSARGWQGCAIQTCRGKRKKSAETVGALVRASIFVSEIGGEYTTLHLVGVPVGDLALLGLWGARSLDDILKVGLSFRFVSFRRNQPRLFEPRTRSHF